MKDLTIRLETEQDYRAVEELHRNAFWNLSEPGCSEHYLAHILREHPDFIAQLDYVAELDGKVIGNVMYTKATLADEQGQTRNVLCFGPIGVDPNYQRRGIGRLLLEKTFEEAVKMGYQAIVIFGNPDNYVARGFKSCKKYNVCLEGDVFPTAMLVKELTPGFFDGRKFYFHDSEAYACDPQRVEEFDRGFEPREKGYQTSQEEFYIHCRSVMR